MFATIKVGNVDPTQVNFSVCQYSRVSMFVIKWDSTFVIWCDRKHGQEYRNIFSKQNGCFIKLQATRPHMKGDNREKLKFRSTAYLQFKKKQKIIGSKTCYHLRTNTARLSMV
jgi:hypothetical protein